MSNPHTCPHLSTQHFAPPSVYTAVYKDECTLCFESQDSEAGIDVCLTCFNGGCVADNHGTLHFNKTQHPIVLNLRRIPIERAKRLDSPPPNKMSKLAIVPENEEDKYETLSKIKCHACGDVEINAEDNVLPTVEAVLNSLSSSKQSEVKAWEEEIVSCQHTQGLVQEEGRQLEAQSMASCQACDLKENLWLCLTCGSLGCGRKQFDGSGGNGHGLQHFQETGHGISCKLGTITPEGTADIYCYLCDDQRIDPCLSQHLAHFGVDVADSRKTEKSMAELQLEQNLKFDFSMVTEDGKQLEPVFGPGFTGLKNLGNSCYMSSVLQSVFALDPIAARYTSMIHEHRMRCQNEAASCFQCQMCKLADGLLSGKYSKPVEIEGDKQGQKGIPPSMFKSLIGKGHPEFSTMRQQDAFEFFQHLLKTMEQKERNVEMGDPSLNFKFNMEQRLECLKCHKVRYSKEVTSSLTIPTPIRKVGESTDEGVQYEPVTLDECLNSFVTENHVPDYNCPNCQEKTSASTCNKFSTFPDVLIVNIRRFEYENWVPKKINVPVVVNQEETSLDGYKSLGQQPNEELLPEVSEAASAPEVDPNALDQLLSMGFPEVRCRKALINTGNNGAEIAMNWLFEHMEDPDIDTPLETAAATDTSESSDADIQMLTEMGFTPAQAKKALKETQNNMERAVEWLFSHSEDIMDEDSTEEPQTTKEPGNGELPAKYKLSSFISHKGTSVHCGHYVAHVRKENQWYLFNDEKVVATPNPPIDEAYIYVFRRC
ncbi:ubiquitinyl hydrolase [Basidiobolus meristosporus CBS 931.73]|uniref:Ubiquitin carboxyl-terminal hydrolase n=1 Tax=Basidiobolus meristosporus CBS 931.73 TaxID=1314790 RepID=A0A1Y1YMD1_9FUNG|nr:ubiquitinyl hydrolase [Basidiobolus meristosporus CBS 931.73]|eukprot:ORX99167.1 ubiquitinyl hydrolase [Basidiobolus meristosporus CBS 931.73]